MTDRFLFGVAVVASVIGVAAVADGLWLLLALAFGWSVWEPLLGLGILWGALQSLALYIALSPRRLMRPYPHSRI